jgi:hypothetical protein
VWPSVRVLLPSLLPRPEASLLVRSGRALPSAGFVLLLLAHQSSSSMMVSLLGFAQSLTFFQLARRLTMLSIQLG